MSKQDISSTVSVDAEHSTSVGDDLRTQWQRVVGRRSFLTGVALAGAAAIPGSALFASEATAASRELTEGDVAILRLLAAIELIESDLWQQYNELVSCGINSFAVASDGVEDLLGGLGPDVGTRVLVPVVDPVADVSVERPDRSVLAAAQQLGREL
jgi:hypothetical protein